MNRLTRQFVLPLLFAGIAVSTVVVLGEPVQAATALAQPASLPTVIVLNEQAEDLTDQAELPSRVERASRLRWFITLPGARNRGCCRRPV